VTAIAAHIATASSITQVIRYAEPNGLEIGAGRTGWSTLASAAAGTTDLLSP
jgi:hypothetical protein